MPHRFRQRLAAGSALTALVVTAGVAAATLPAIADPAPSAASTYLSDTLPGLAEDTVLTPITFERFEDLLAGEGTYAFLIGGPADATTRAAAQHIDAVARQYGVDAVYTFDPRLDGDRVDIRTYGDAGVANSAGAQLRALYTRLVTDYLNKDTTPQFGSAATDPYFFVYDKSHTQGGAEDRIVASLTGAVSEAILSSQPAIAEYRASIAAAFDTVAVGGRAELDTKSQFAFFSEEINGKHARDYRGLPQYGGDIFSEADAAGFRLQSITYPELLALLESEDPSTILFGGTWCHNTRAVIGEVNRAARASGTDTVYVFDLRLDGASGNNLHIRDTASSLSFLYGDLVARYLPDLRTQYRLDGSAGQRVEYRPGGDTTAALATAKKLQVPYLIEYDKGREVAGTPAPIAKDWIRDNGDGTFTEYMTEWWWVSHIAASARTGESEESRAARQAAAWAFADEAIEKVDAFFGVTAQPEPTGSPTGSPEPTSSPTTSPEPTSSPEPTTSPSASPEPTSSPLPTSTPTSGASATPALAVTGSLTPGGRITIGGDGLPASADVRVELHSTPVVLGTTSVTAAGTFSLTATIPASTPAGAHAIVVFADGLEIARSPITVSSGALAATGSDGLPLWGAGIALALLAAGAATVIGARRRREV